MVYIYVELLMRLAQNHSPASIAWLSDAPDLKMIMKKVLGGKNTAVSTCVCELISLILHQDTDSVLSAQLCQSDLVGESYIQSRKSVHTQIKNNRLYRV